MDNERLKNAVNLAKKSNYIFVSTSNNQGVPHLAAARRVEYVKIDTISVTEWFCPETVRNLQENHSISVVIWDSTKDIGYQLLGTLKRIENLEMVDGFIGPTEIENPIPQIERRLILKITKILPFKHAPHTDMEEKMVLEKVAA